jgi:YHS domain-containing protein
MDAMKLTEGKGLITKCDISGQYDGKTYCFGDETTKAAFMKEPAGNRAKADAIYATKASDPNWKACNYETASQEGCE